MYSRILGILTIAGALTIGIVTLQDNGLCLAQAEKKKTAQEERKLRIEKREECWNGCRQKFPHTDDLSRKLHRDCRDNCTKTYRDQ